MVTALRSSYVLKFLDAETCPDIWTSGCSKQSWDDWVLLEQSQIHVHMNSFKLVPFISMTTVSCSRCKSMFLKSPPVCWPGLHISGCVPGYGPDSRGDHMRKIHGNWTLAHAGVSAANMQPCLTGTEFNAGSQCGCAGMLRRPPSTSTHTEKHTNREDEPVKHRWV